MLESTGERKKQKAEAGGSLERAIKNENKFKAPGLWFGFVLVFWRLVFVFLLSPGFLSCFNLVFSVMWVLVHYCLS